MPLPSNLPSETIQLISSAQRHQAHLFELQIPALRTCKGPLSLQQSLAAELREDIEAFSRQVEVRLCSTSNSKHSRIVTRGKALDISVGDLRGDTSRRELGDVVNELKEALGRCVVSSYKTEISILRMGQDTAGRSCCTSFFEANNRLST
jgi:protein transport protein SEC20